jgi:hypothetical protein
MAQFGRNDLLFVVDEHLSDSVADSADAAPSQLTDNERGTRP